MSMFVHMCVYEHTAWRSVMCSIRGFVVFLLDLKPFVLRGYE